MLAGYLESPSLGLPSLSHQTVWPSCQSRGGYKASPWKECYAKNAVHIILCIESMHIIPPLKQKQGLGSKYPNWTHQIILHLSWSNLNVFIKTLFETTFFMLYIMQINVLPGKDKVTQVGQQINMQDNNCEIVYWNLEYGIRALCQQNWL